MSDHNYTLNWYRENADEFIHRTNTVDMSELYRTFMPFVPPGGHVMDLGCGSGSAALYFTQAGYQVLAVDGCREMCDYTHKRVGCPARCLRFEELDYENAFDGVWACASLLHLRKSELPQVLRRICHALKTGGVFYASFKYGDMERSHNGRVFSDFTEETLRDLMDKAGGFREIALWNTFDARPGREDERWVNILCRAE